MFCYLGGAGNLIYSVHSPENKKTITFSGNHKLMMTADKIPNNINQNETKTKRRRIT